MNTGTVYAVVQEIPGSLTIRAWAWSKDNARAVILNLRDRGIDGIFEIIETHIREVREIKHYNVG